VAIAMGADSGSFQIRARNAGDVAAAVGGYAQVCEVRGAQRLAFVSGQVPQAQDGQVPEGFADQCRLVWANVESQLRAVDMTLDSIVKVTTFLACREHADGNAAIRNEVLAGRSPALTVIITGIFDPAWLLEIEVVAAA
jgi:2-iminobutanoate/2-iminopropanoate deaminase